MSDAGAQLIVDAHVHLHGCFDPEAGLDAAWDHFAAVADGQSFSGVLMLAEPVRDDAFDPLRSSTWSRWALEAGPEAQTRWARREGRALLVVAGFQVPTAEGLEVLCLGTRERPADGAPLGSVVRQARERGALAVLPWGAGKWLGRRGAVLTRFLAGVEDAGVFLGDNGGRPGFWRPRHFALAARSGVRLLPGSDPLPFASQARSVGSHGFVLPGVLSEGSPASDLIRMLEQRSARPVPFGRSEAPLRFVFHQLAMQWRLGSARLRS